MNIEITKADWKLYRQKLASWQEHYMEQLVLQYQALLNGPGLASDRFWELDKRIRRHRTHPGVIVEMRRGNVVATLANLLVDNVISVADLEGFSPELKDAATTLARIWNKHFGEPEEHEDDAD